MEPPFPQPKRHGLSRRRSRRHPLPDPAPAPAPEADAGAASSPAPPAKADDAINLGSTVLPILVKNYWKQGLAALVVIAVIVILIAM